MSCKGHRKQKKVKATIIKKGPIISFSDNDYLGGFDHDHDDSISICPMSQLYDFRITANMMETYKVAHKNKSKLELM